MNQQSLGAYLALHRTGYLLAGLWAALWLGLLVGFFWYFRFESLGFMEGDSAFDAFMQTPVSKTVQTSRFAAMCLLIPLAALLAGGVLILADALLYVFRLDRNKLWFEAVKWTLGGWKAGLVWLAAFSPVWILLVSIDQAIAFWISALLAMLLVIALPFMIWNRDYVVSNQPAIFVMPQWPGSQPILLSGIFIAISAPLMAIYGTSLGPKLHPWMILLFDILQNAVFAISALLLSYFWINRSVKITSGKPLNPKSISSLFSLNLMSGLWGLVLLILPFICSAIVLAFLLPSIKYSYREQNLEIPALLKYFASVGDFFAAYWWLLLPPAMLWFFVHVFGRLIFLLDLVEDAADPLNTRPRPG
jgi:hypothetical protein